MTLRNIIAAACLLLPLWASAHNIEKDNVYRQSALLTGEN